MRAGVAALAGLLLGMPTDWAKLDRQRYLRRREAKYDGAPLWGGEGGKTPFFREPPFEFKSRFESDPNNDGLLLEKRVYETKLHPHYKERETENFSQNIVGIYHRKHPERNRKKQTDYIDARLIQDENNMGETTLFLENKRREARLTKKSYRHLNLKELSASELRQQHFSTLSALATEIEASYEPLVDDRKKPKKKFEQSQTMKRLASGKSSVRPPGERDKIQLY